MTATTDEHGLACEPLAHPTAVITTRRSHSTLYISFPKARLRAREVWHNWLAGCADRVPD